MERIIKFRAQDEDKIWHFGNYDQDNQEIFYTHIDADGCHRAHIPIVPCTVGEFSGFKDIDDVEIYEADFLLVDEEYIGEVKRARSGSWFWFRVINGQNPIPLYKLTNNNLKVIGNIHDNPELGGKTK